MEKIMKVFIGPFIDYEEDVETKDREIKVKIHDYDYWNADNTLAYIIVPVLQKLSDNIHSYPHAFEVSDDEDGSKGSKAWKKTLKKMIWAFTQCTIEWEDQYHTGVIDFVFVKENKGNLSRLEHGPNHTSKIDYKGMEKHEKKMQEGFDLFAKYYLNLWD